MEFPSPLSDRDRLEMGKFEAASREAWQNKQDFLDEEAAFDRRTYALEAASRLYATRGKSWVEETVDAAQRFEQYLKDGE